jgi:short-subunit dehydrogenase
MGTALITGASSGIGLELADVLAADGHNLVLVARREQALRALAGDLERRHGIQATAFVADLARLEERMRLASDLSGEGAEIDVLVNNAGFGLRGPFASTPVERDLEMIEVNIAALTHLTRLFLPGMLTRRTGRILQVASTAAFQPGPLMAVYYATKAYVLSFSTALAVELEGTGVTCTALCPGPTRTEFQAVARMGGTALASAAISMDARTVARLGYRGLMRGKAVVVPGWLNKAGVVGAKLAPRLLAARIAKLSQDARGGR